MVGNPGRKRKNGGDVSIILLEVDGRTERHTRQYNRAQISVPKERMNGISNRARKQQSENFRDKQEKSRPTLRTSRRIYVADLSIREAGLAPATPFGLLAEMEIGSAYSRAKSLFLTRSQVAHEGGDMLLCETSSSVPGLRRAAGG